MRAPPIVAVLRDYNGACMSGERRLPCSAADGSRFLTVSSARAEDTVRAGGSEIAIVDRADLHAVVRTLAPATPRAAGATLAVFAVAVPAPRVAAAVPMEAMHLDDAAFRSGHAGRWALNRGGVCGVNGEGEQACGCCARQHFDDHCSSNFTERDVSFHPTLIQFRCVKDNRQSRIGIRKYRRSSGGLNPHRSTVTIRFPGRVRAHDGGLRVRIAPRVAIVTMRNVRRRSCRVGAGNPRLAASIYRAG